MKNNQRFTMNSTKLNIINDILSKTKITCNDLSKADPNLIEMFYTFQIDHLNLDTKNETIHFDLFCYEKPLE